MSTKSQAPFVGTEPITLNKIDCGPDVMAPCSTRRRESINKEKYIMSDSDVAKIKLDKGDRNTEGM